VGPKALLFYKLVAYILKKHINRTKRQSHWKVVTQNYRG